MTAASPPEAVDRRHHRSIWLGGALTRAFVAAGSALAASVMPLVPTPSNVAEAYVEARLTDDWAEAWELMCAPSRSELGGYSSFAERAADVNHRSAMPSEVDASVVADSPQATTPPSALADVIVTSDERSEDWELHEFLDLVVENGKFRACGGRLVR